MTDLISHYLGIGFTVIPILPLSKRAAVEWKKYQTERPTPEEIAEWRRLWDSGYNLAVVCGYASSGLVVIDIDAYRSDRLLSVLKLEKLKNGTLVVETPSGGYHIYFFTKGPTPSFNLMQSGEVIAEVRGDGRYVLAPPSRCVPKSGGDPKSYTIISSTMTPATITEDIRYELLRILRKSGSDQVSFKEEIHYVESFVSRGKPYRGKPMPCIQKLAEGVREGFRNEAAMRMASFYLNLRRYSPEKAWRYLLAWNEVNDPPLPERELRSCFNSVLKRGYVYGCSSLAIVYCDRTRCPLKPLITIPSDVSGYDWYKQAVKRAKRKLI